MRNLFGEITHLQNTTVSKMPVICMGMENSTFHSGPRFMWHRNLYRSFLKCNFNLNGNKSWTKMERGIFVP